MFFFQAEDGIRDTSVTGVQTCALPICLIVLWLLGSLAFHVSASMIHILLVVGIVLLFHQGRYQNSKGGRRAPPSGNARDRKSTRLNSSHRCISYAVFCLKKKKKYTKDTTHAP